MSLDDISLEPLFNAGKVGDKPGMVPIDQVGAASHRAFLAVTDTEEEIVIGDGKRSIEIFNSGSNVIYYGGTGVGATTGIPIFPNNGKFFGNVKSDFSIFIVAVSGSNSERKIIEYA